jgi:hypothetical protein
VNGLSIVVSTSVVTSGGFFLADYAEEVAAYSHIIETDGGFREASFTIPADIVEVEDWLESGLGRHVQVFDDAHLVMWEGFVDKVSAAIGARVIERGPLMDAANRISVVYSRIDTSVTPSVVGTRAQTATADNAGSRALYGILYDIYSVSGATDADATQIRDTVLAERAWPETTESISGAGSPPSVTVTCRGYIGWLKKYVYNNAAATGTVNTDAKIRAVLAADPNSVISTNYNWIAANTLQAKAYENDSKTGWAVIASQVARGDASSNRWTFGIYAGRVAYYQSQEMTFSYRYSTSQNELELYAGGVIHPWAVRPGKWIFLRDFLQARTYAGGIAQDPRAMYIESVTFNAPYDLSVNGSRVKTLPQLLARLGLGGTV